MQESTTEVTEQEKPKDNPEQLKSWLEQFAQKYKMATTQKSRLEDLMKRKSTKSWSPEKTAKMVRRLMAANKQIEQAEGALDQLTHRLSQLGIEVDIVSRASGVKAA